MVNKNKRNRAKFVRRVGTRAKLSFDQGQAEYPFYTIKCNTNEKEKGIGMIDIIRDQFEITMKDLDLSKRLMEWDEDSKTPTAFSNIPNARPIKYEPIKWKRDEKGNIISPFATKKPEVAKEDREEEKY